MMNEKFGSQVQMMFMLLRNARTILIICDPGQGNVGDMLGLGLCVLPKVCEVGTCRDMQTPRWLKPISTEVLGLGFMFACILLRSRCDGPFQGVRFRGQQLPYCIMVAGRFIDFGEENSLGKVLLKSTKRGHRVDSG